jgi:hypothetical protein
MEAKDVPQLAAVGLLIGLLTAALGVQLSAGALLGFAIAAYLYVFLDFRPVSRLIGFAVIAMLAIFVFQLFAPFLVVSGWNQWKDPPVLFSRAVRAGSAEIVVILIACSILLVPRAQLLRARSLYTVIGLMIVGGFVAAIGWQSWSTLGMWMWHGFAVLRPTSPLSPREPLSFGNLSFSVVVCTGWAALIGIMLWVNRDAQPTRDFPEKTKARAFWPIYVLLSPGLVAVFLGAKEGIGFQRQLTEKSPPTVVGWVKAPRDFAQVFVTDGIDGASPGMPKYGFSFASDVRTQIIEYSMQFQSSDVKDSATAPIAWVAVKQFPNAAWASRDLRQLPLPAAIELYPSTIKKKMMFGHVILSCTFIDEPNFYWASGDTTIEIRFKGTAINDELLKKYLDRYPSDDLPSIYSQLDRTSNRWRAGD